MYKRVSPGRLILAAFVVISSALSHEPDGRVAFRFDWPEKSDASQGAPLLRLTLTAAVPLSEAQLVVTLPEGVELSVRAAGRAPMRWPLEGLKIGELAAGQTVVVELDVAKQARGGGVVGFALEATSGGVAVREGVGVPVGNPGTEPTLRNGAVEFPAAREVPTP